MARIHDGLMMLLIIGRNSVLWLFSYCDDTFVHCDVIYIHCDVTSIHSNVAFSMFFTTMV